MTVTPEVTQLEINHEVFIRNAQWTDAIVLVAGAAQSYTVQAGVKFLTFECTDNFYVLFNGGTAAVPGATTTDGSAPSLNPTQRIVTPADVLSIISPANCILTISAYGT
jgi:hypothetical protein